jgi:predicted thioesterase
VPLEVGLSSSTEHVVSADDLAPVFASGDVPVLATPRVIAWFEEASMRSVEDDLDEGQTTVGMRIRVDHVAPSGPGSRVSVIATLSRIEGRRLTFQVQASDDENEIALGQVVRVVVDRQRFLERV